MYYAPHIFMSTGLAAENAVFQSVSIGITMLIFTVVAMLFVDKFGRKPLSIIGITLMFVFLGLVSLTFFQQNFDGYWVLIYIMGYIAAFSLSIGPIVWVQIAEIFPNRIRSNAIALATLCMWTANYLVTRTFPILLETFTGSDSGYTFLIYAFFCIVMLFYVIFQVPETKGKSLEELEKELTSK